MSESTTISLFANRAALDSSWPPTAAWTPPSNVYRWARATPVDPVIYQYAMAARAIDLRSIFDEGQLISATLHWNIDVSMSGSETDVSPTTPDFLVATGAGTTYQPVTSDDIARITLSVGSAARRRVASGSLALSSGLFAGDVATFHAGFDAATQPGVFNVEGTTPPEVGEAVVSITSFSVYIEFVYNVPEGECPPPEPYIAPLPCDYSDTLPAIGSYRAADGALILPAGTDIIIDTDNNRGVFWFETCHIERASSRMLLRLPLSALTRTDSPPDCYPAIRGYYAIGPEHPATGELQPTLGDGIATYFESGGVEAFPALDLWSLELAGMAPGVADIELTNTSAATDRMTGIVVEGIWTNGTGSIFITPTPELIVCYPNDGSGDGGGMDHNYGGNPGGENPDGTDEEENQEGPTHTSAKLNRETALRAGALESVRRRPELVYETRLRAEGGRRVEQ